jgi:putative ABC transport system permease protein
MNKKFVNFIVRKYLKFDKTQPFISVSFILAFLGIATGVGVLIIAMSIIKKINYYELSINYLFSNRKY